RARQQVQQLALTRRHRDRGQARVGACPQRGLQRGVLADQVLLREAIDCIPLGLFGAAHSLCPFARESSSENSCCCTSAGNGRINPELSSVTSAGPSTKPRKSRYTGTLTPRTKKLAVIRQPKPPVVPGAGGTPAWIETGPTFAPCRCSPSNSSL